MDWKTHLKNAPRRTTRREPKEQQRPNPSLRNRPGCRGVYVESKWTSQGISTKKTVRLKNASVGLVFRHWVHRPRPRRRGFEVVSVDWCPKFSPTICADILTWDYKAAFPKDHFQFCWMSPECRMFSIARTTGPPADRANATALVAKCLEIAEFYRCEWCMETLRLVP